MNDNMIDIGSRLKELRKDKGLTQNDIAKVFNINSVTYLHYEKNQRRPSYEFLVALAYYYDVTTDYLLSKTDY